MSRWLLIVLLAVSCQKAAVEVTRTNNPQVKVERLFDYDGCTVYRFVDGDWHYFVRCNHDAATTDVKHRMCGKTPCPYPEEIPTEER